MGPPKRGVSFVDKEQGCSAEYRVELDQQLYVQRFRLYYFRLYVNHFTSLHRTLNTCFSRLLCIVGTFLILPINCNANFNTD